MRVDDIFCYTFYCCAMTISCYALIPFQDYSANVYPVFRLPVGRKVTFWDS